MTEYGYTNEIEKMSLFKKLLEKAKSGKKLVSVRYDRSDSERIHIGRVIAYNDEMLILNSYNKRGQYDGQVLIEFEEIVAIEYDDSILRRTQHWIDYQAQIFDSRSTAVRRLAADGFEKVDSLRR